jgi:hypothetical protein
MKHGTIRKEWMEMLCKNSRQGNSKMSAMLHPKGHRDISDPN